jgi:hypothetical protein
MTGCLFCILCVLFEVWLLLASLLLLVMAAADALLGLVNIDLRLLHLLHVSSWRPSADSAAASLADREDEVHIPCLPPRSALTYIDKGR